VQIEDNMMVVTGREFRANQSKFIGAAYRGEEVVVKARAGSFRIVPSNEHIANAFKKIEHLATLSHNWDGYGALPISDKVIRNLQSVLSLSENEDWKDWIISPESNATLCLESLETEATISIGDHEFSYFGMNNGKRISKSHEVFTPKAVLGTMRMLSKEKLT